FPIVGTTGRTAVRAQGIGNLSVAGSAINLTVSRRALPFQNSFSGIDHLASARFGGNADAVGLDVPRPIGHPPLARGLGNPTGSPPNVATTWGTPTSIAGYPAYGLLGGLVTGSRIGSITAGPATQKLLTANDPDLVQLYRVGGFTTWYPKAGNALTNAAIVSS